MAGGGGFMELGGGIVECVGGIGLLWYAAEEFDDFVLRVDWRASDVTDDSGVFVRFPALDPVDWQRAVTEGYEVQIDGRGFNPDTNAFDDATHRSGAIYALGPSTSLTSRPMGEWNTFEIEAVGQRIRVALNGTPVCDYTGDGSRPARGHIGLQNHHAGSRVQFRRLRIKPLTATAPANALSTAAWRGAPH
jgi:hypothetical protein